MKDRIDIAATPHTAAGGSATGLSATGARWPLPVIQRTLRRTDIDVDRFYPTSSMDYGWRHRSI